MIRVPYLFLILGRIIPGLLLDFLSIDKSLTQKLESKANERKTKLCKLRKLCILHKNEEIK